MRRSPAPWAVLGGILVLIGWYAHNVQEANHLACSSFGGQLAQSFDAQAARSCGVDNTIWTGGIVVAGVGVVLIVIAIVLTVERRNRD